MTELITATVVADLLLGRPAHPRVGAGRAREAVVVVGNEPTTRLGIPAFGPISDS